MGHGPPHARRIIGNDDGPRESGVGMDSKAAEGFKVRVNRPRSYLGPAELHVGGIRLP